MDDCLAVLNNGTFVLENSRIRRVYAWNEGHLIGRMIEDKVGGQCWRLENTSPDLELPGVEAEPSNGTLELDVRAATALAPAHLRASATTTLGSLQVRRTFRIYPDCPAIACDLFLRGTPPRLWTLLSLCDKSTKPWIRACQHWVVDIAQQYAGHGVPLEELIYQGLIVLVHMIKRLEPLEWILESWSKHDNPPENPRLDRYLMRSVWIAMHTMNATIPVQDRIDQEWNRIGEALVERGILADREPLLPVDSRLDNVGLDQLRIQAITTGWQNKPRTAVLERLCIPGPHLKLNCVQFFDATDRRNTLVNRQTILPYRHETRLSGNLLLIQDTFSDAGLFILKEAPCSDVQLAWPGFDFTLQIGDITTVGIGIEPADLHEANAKQPGETIDKAEWMRGYGFVTGVAAGGEVALLSALRTYQEQIRIHKPGRDEMILLNTWGDRGQDTKISERFALAELEQAHRLGITHFQLDDGWQTGRSSNSAFEGGSLEGIWEEKDYWKPHPDRFPDGLGPVARRATELGIELCLWFNPSKDKSYMHWQNDAQALIWLNRTYGIRTFKIDGVVIPDKEADRNLRAMFEQVMAATGDEAVFNLDVTAGQRWGYHYGNEYGNIFLENRYTDWSNYYPHWTLRNLWMLSRYVPAQNLQIEFLNKWRNADLYPDDDLLAPHRVPWDYCFAVTMMAQPLAWFEATGLPEEAFAIAPLIKTYGQHQQNIHAGQILPIGKTHAPDNAPTGSSWTGFQSIQENSGYVVTYREWTSRDKGILKLWNLENKQVQFEHIAGAGADFTKLVEECGMVTFHLPEPFSFALYRYLVLR